MVHPAYRIPATGDQLQALGEICAIQGQIEWLMQSSYAYTMGVSGEYAKIALGSTNLNANAEIWLLSLYQRRHLQPNVSLHWAEHVVAEIAAVSGGRNDLIHAVFGYELTLNATGQQPETFFTIDEPRTIDSTAARVVAMRVKTSKLNSMERIGEVRDHLARLSIIMADIWHCCRSSAPSPWRDKLAKQPPPLAGKAKSRLEQALQPPPQPS